MLVEIASLTSEIPAADIYGASEGILGEFRSYWEGQGREPLQIFTKYVPNIFQIRPTPSNVSAAIRRSLTSLG